MTSRPPDGPGAAPLPLIVAAAVAAAQGAVFLGYAVLEIVRTDQARLAMGATTSIFFLLYGLALVLCGWRLVRLDAWARSPLVLAQLIHLGLAWSFWGEGTRAVSVVLVAVSGVVLGGLLHPQSTRALAERPV